MDSGPLRGTGVVKCGPRDLGTMPYQVEVSAGGHASIVRFEQRLKVKDGEQLHLTLEDGRMLDCQVLDASSYCAVVGDGPYPDRRAAARGRH
jgi:hypothetical protein